MKCLIVIFFIIDIVVCIPQLAVAGESQKTSYEQVYDQLMALAPDPTKGAQLSHIVIKRDVAEFSLEEGEIFLCTPVVNRICAVAFHGKGTFSFAPALRVERDQLSRFFERESLNEPFTFLVVIFADSTLRELYHKCKFRELPMPKWQQKIQGALSY